jgi:hypothetical protein
MSEVVSAYSNGSHKFFVKYTENPDNPLTYSGWEFTTVNTRYFSSTEDAISLEELKSKKEDFYIYPIGAYIHDDVALHFGYINRGFDECTAGYIYSKKSIWESEEKAEEAAKSEISDFEAYINGQCFAVTEEDEEGEIVDTFGDFYSEEAVLNFIKELSKGFELTKLEKKVTVSWE